MASSQRMKVAVRCRPPNEEEERILLEATGGDGTDQTEVELPLWTEDGKNAVFVGHGDDDQPQTYDIDYAFGLNSTNDQLFDVAVAPLVARAFDGFNATVLAYGASGSGKGHCLFRQHGQAGHTGIVERALEDMFQRIRQDSKHQFLVTFSMFQIQQENVTDLLAPGDDSSSPLTVADHRALGAYVPDLCEVVVHDWEECAEFLNQGLKVLTATMKRSGMQGKPHVFIDLRVEAQENGNLIAPIRHSLLRFVSLKGSGGMAADTDGSLQALHKCIEGLAAQADLHSLPHQTSTVTRLLQPALGGNSCALFLATVDPIPGHIQDSVRTLDIAVKAHACSTQPVKNQSLIADTLRQIRQDIREARSKLQLDQPGHYMHDVDPTLLDKLKHLLTELEKTKQNTWDARIKRSQEWLETRKKRLRKAGLFLVLEEETKVDSDLVRKVEKARHDLVKQTREVEKQESQLQEERQQFEELLAACQEQQEQPSPEDLQELEQSIKTRGENVQHQLEKLAKMRKIFSRYIHQIVESEERQRKTFLLAPERYQAKYKLIANRCMNSAELHVARDAEDWKEIELLKGADRRLRKKMKELKKAYEEDVATLEAKYESGEPIAAETARQLEEEAKTIMFRKSKQVQELAWERDQLLGRLIEREFRHQAQLARMQKQLFMVFREYRRHFGEQKHKVEHKFRGMLEESVHDALFLSRENTKLKMQVEELQQQLGRTNSTHGLNMLAADEAEQKYAEGAYGE